MFSKTKTSTKKFRTKVFNFMIQFTQNVKNYITAKRIVGEKNCK